MTIIYGRQLFEARDEKGFGNLFRSARYDSNISDFRRSHHVVNVKARSCSFSLDELFGLTHRARQQA